MTLRLRRYCLLAAVIWSYVVVSQHAKAMTCDPADVPCNSGQGCYSAAHHCDGHAQCLDGTDEANCSDTQDDKSKVHSGSGHQQENLAWLVTPVLFLLGVAYAIYKCIKDGVCRAIKNRIVVCVRGEEIQASDYHPLHHVTFHTSTQIPCAYMGPNPHNPQMMVHHNQSFRIVFRNGQPVALAGGAAAAATGPPSYEEAILNRLKQPTYHGQMIAGAVGEEVLPSYGEAVAVAQATSADSGTTSTAPANAVATSSRFAVSTVNEEEEEEENNDDSMVFDERSRLMTAPSGDERGNTRHAGRRRHHSQWNPSFGSSNGGGSSSGCNAFRRRHHSQP